MPPLRPRLQILSQAPPNAQSIRKLLLTKDDKKNSDLWQRWEDALIEQAGFFDNNGQEEQGDRSDPPASRVETDVAKSSTEYKDQREKRCDELLTHDGCKEDVDGLVGRSETLLVKEEFEEAVRTFERAFESTGGRLDRDIHQRLQRAQKLFKQSKLD
ncbi:hypothetical protein CPC08DRAFT_770301 [Agrocybe pediades]|nr:hypothetical protein CPC08DRAFT_770301 [Agrocybe pediades]